MCKKTSQHLRWTSPQHPARGLLPSSLSAIDGSVQRDLPRPPRSEAAQSPFLPEIGLGRGMSRFRLEKLRQDGCHTEAISKMPWTSRAGQQSKKQGSGGRGGPRWRGERRGGGKARACSSAPDLASGGEGDAAGRQA